MGQKNGRNQLVKDKKALHSQIIKIEKHKDNQAEKSQGKQDELSQAKKN